MTTGSADGVLHRAQPVQGRCAPCQYCVRCVTRAPAGSARMPVPMHLPRAAMLESTRRQPAREDAEHWRMVKGASRVGQRDHRGEHGRAFVGAVLRDVEEGRRTVGVPRAPARVDAAVTPRTTDERGLHPARRRKRTSEYRLTSKSAPWMAALPVSQPSVLKMAGTPRSQPCTPTGWLRTRHASHP